jgi:protein-tyrosine phosphatase
VLDLSIITREILVGTQVTGDEDLDALKKIGVGGLLSLQDEDDLRRAGLRWDLLQKAGAGRDIDMRRVPIIDFDPGDLVAKIDRCVTELDDLLSESPRVYVHCTAGINRSAGVVLSYLVLRKRLTVDVAFKLLQSRRPQVNPYRSLVTHLMERQAG